VRPGVPFDAPHQRALGVLVDGMLELGLLTGDREEILAKELYRPLYLHRTSHWLGMDVHDVGKYRLNDQPRLLEAGMVLTIEPGLYVGAERDDVPGCYRGIGVRIEDDVLVTADGHDVLSAAVPKEPADIEALRSAAR